MRRSVIRRGNGRDERNESLSRRAPCWISGLCFDGDVSVIMNLRTVSRHETVGELSEKSSMCRHYYFIFCFIFCLTIFLFTVLEKRGNN